MAFSKATLSQTTEAVSLESGQGTTMLKFTLSGFFFSSSVPHQDFLVPTNYTCPHIVFFFNLPHSLYGKKVIINKSLSIYI